MKAATLILSVLLTLAILLCSCGKEVTNAEISEPQSSAPEASDNAPKGNAAVGEESGSRPEMHFSYAAPDYDYQLHMSDAVIYGEVTEELGGSYIDPDNLRPGSIGAWGWQYTVRADKVFKGSLNEGDTVTVISRRVSGYSPEDEKNLNIFTDGRDYQLTKGDKAVFLLQKDDCTDGAYGVVYGSEGAFFPVTEGDASMSENAETVYASNSLKLKLSELSYDIARAEAEYANDDGKSELLADDEDEEE